MNVTLEALNYIYGADTPFVRRALKDISLEIRQGEYVGLIGHTGSGKSTLIQHLNGLLRPTSGRVLIDGEDIWKDAAFTCAVRFRVGLVFQYPEYQLFEESVYKDIAFGPTNMGLSKGEVDERVMSALEQVGLPAEIAVKSPFELSGGQKRRVAIAGVMAMQPEFLILDEPAAGLDPSGRREIIEEISEYRKRHGATVLLVSHSMEDIASTVERILVMDDGAVIMDGDADSVFADARRLIDIGLDVPQVTKVLISLKARGFDINDRLYTVEDAKGEIMRLYRALGGGSSCSRT